jgi:hypothetical protein
MSVVPTISDDQLRRWTVWDLFLRTGTAEICDAQIGGVEIVPEHPTRALGAGRLAIGPLLRFGLEEARPDGRTPMDVIARHVSPGDVVAVHSGGAELAVMGGRLASRVIVCGGCAVVTDGRLRDANELGRLPIAAWANANTPSGGTKPGSYRLVEGPSRLFGLQWNDGDWYAQDEDGALRISAAALDVVVDRFGRVFNR